MNMRHDPSSIEPGHYIIGQNLFLAENSEIVFFAISSVFECIGLAQDLKLVLMKN